MSLAPPALVLHCRLTCLDLILALGYVETDKLLNAFLVLLLSGAAGWVLTWLSERSLWLPHLLVHPGQTQPEEKTDEQKSVKNTSKLGNKRTAPKMCVHKLTYSVTMSALACCTAILNGSWPSSSPSFCVAPLFRNKHTCLKIPEKKRSITANTWHLTAGSENNWKCRHF